MKHGSAADAFANFLRWNYGTVPEDYEVSEVRGYWRRKVPCGGRGKCSSPIHGFLFNEGPMQHTVHFTDEGRDKKGRWTRLYSTWEAARSSVNESSAPTSSEHGSAV